MSHELNDPLFCMDIQQKEVGVGEKRPRSVYESQSQRSASIKLPSWFTRADYTCNTTMPSLKEKSADLAQHLGVDDIKVARYGGVYCPVHLQKGQFYVHHSNGVYIGIQVSWIYVLLCLYKIFICLVV